MNLKRLTLLAFATVVLAAAGPAVSQFPEPLLGAWEEDAGKTLMNVQPERIALFDGATLSFRGLIRTETDSLVLRNEGLKEFWKYKLLENGKLSVETGKGRMLLNRLNAPPPAVQLEPLPLGAATALPADRVLAIQNEIATRFRHEQDLVKDPARKSGYPAAVAENRTYLVNLIREIGWIDSGRFGSQTALYATIIAKHTEDLGLMMTALPFAESAFKDSGDGQTYAVLYDAFQLHIGEPQRYGTQVGEDENGNPFLLPVENDDVAAVNERLRSMGIPPLEKYLEDLRVALYPDKKEIRIAKEAAY